MNNLIIVIIVSILISYIFYVVISNKWLPSKNILISFLIGCSLVPVAILLEKETLLNTLISNNENYKIIAFVLVEEFLKIASLFLFIKFNKNDKNNFVELLGIGIGFSFVESIMYSYNGGLGLFSGILNTSLLTLVLRSTGALIMHTITIAIVSLSILYFKNKRKIIIYILSIIFGLIFHFFFNFFIQKGSGENFLTVFSITWLLFLILYILYLYLDYKNNNLLTIKKFRNRIAVFIGKYLLFIVFMIASLVLIDSGIGGLKNYSEKDIEQAKIVQQDIIKYIDSWTENLPEGYKKYPNEVESIVEKLNIINNHYSRIIFITEEGDNLSGEDLSFLRTNGGEKKDEVYVLIDNLYRKFYIDKYKSDIKRLKDESILGTKVITENKINDSLKKEFFIYKDMIDVLIKEEENISNKLEENPNITKGEIDELLKPLNDKFMEYIKQGELLINLMKK